MNKEKYLDELYQALQKFEIESPTKHITEYDYIIGDMLDDKSIEEIITELGTPEHLANNIATEFNYQPKQMNQYSDPIAGKKTYNPNQAPNSTLLKVVNVLFIIFTIIYFTTVIGSLFTGIISLIGLNYVLELAVSNVSGFLLIGLGLVMLTVACTTFYMILLNLKRKLIIHLTTPATTEGVK